MMKLTCQCLSKNKTRGKTASAAAAPVKAGRSRSRLMAANVAKACVLLNVLGEVRK